MGYRVDYQPIRKVRRGETRKNRTAAMTAICLLLFFFLVGIMWPKGTEVLQKILFAGDAEITASALEHFALELGAGEAFPSAFETFCRTVIQHGKADMH